MIKLLLAGLVLSMSADASTFRTEAGTAVATSSSSATIPSIPVKPVYAPLPEGPGLAAKYPGDAGIGGDPSVLFFDGFEEVKGGQITHDPQPGDGKNTYHKWDVAYGDCRVSTDSKRAHGGRQCLDWSIPSGPEPTGAGMSKWIPGQRVVFWRYYIWYDKSFPGSHHVGGGIEGRAPGVPHANPGVYPDGKNKITVLLDHWSFEKGTVQPGPQVAYIYHLDQVHEWGEQFYPSGKIQPGTNMYNKLLGDEFIPRRDFIPPKGKWLCREMMVDAGTPGGRDGRVAFWDDGRLAADFHNLRFRTDPNLLLNRVDLNLYESRNNGVHKLRYDDVVAATMYIGPMARK